MSLCLLLCGALLLSSMVTDVLLFYCLFVCLFVSIKHSLEMDAHHSHWLFQSGFVAVWCVVWWEGLNSQREAEEILLKLLQSTVKGGEAGRGRGLEMWVGTGEWPCMWWLLLLPFLSVTSMNADTSLGCLCSGMWLCFSTRSLLAFPELLPKAAVSAVATCTLDFSWTCILVAVLGSSLCGFYIFFAYYTWSRSISLLIFFFPVVGSLCCFATKRHI